MTTPRDDIAGLTETLKAWDSADLSFLDGDIPTQMQASCREAATQLAALCAEKAELKRENGILRDMLLNPDPSIEPDNLRLHREKCDALDRAWTAEARATRLQQERDEAYERAIQAIRSAPTPDANGYVVTKDAAIKAIRRLASGNEKEGK